jgi:HAD superfamily hydrolase (TIGR01450 family)
MAAIADDYDAAILDLDGVVYRGCDPVRGVPDAIARLRRHGTRIGYVTNNAAQPPDAVVARLQALQIPANESDVVTSAQAAARVLADRYDPGARILALGAAGLWPALEGVGLTPVTCAADQPVAVLQGFDPHLTWERLSEAALAIQHGAAWLATNTDATRPTERGLEPGNGAAVAALRTAVGREPDVAGKPHAPLMTETLRRLESAHPIVVGDRLDTDIAGAAAVHAGSMLVLTGAHGPGDVFAASGAQRPTRVGWSVADLLEPAADPDTDVDVSDGVLQLGRPASELNATQLGAVTGRAARLCWQHADAGHGIDYHRAADDLAAAIARLRMID